MIHDVSTLRRTHREAIWAYAREHLYPFYRLTFPVLSPEAEFIPARHFQVLCTALEKVVTGETPRLLIPVPPRHGKSRLGSVALPAWILGRDPKAKIICASYGDQLARDFALRTRDLMRSNAYRSLFPQTALDVGGTALEELRTSAKGYRLATSVQGVVTGKGANYIIIDDPMKAVEASSEAARNSIYDWVKTALMSRFDRPADGRMVVLMQRLHQDDLIGRLQDEGGWAVLEMPGEAVQEQVFDLGGGERWIYKPGDLLFPEVFNQAALNQLRFDLGEPG
jgi:hypothetical protein